MSTMSETVDFRDKCPNCGRLTMSPWKDVPTVPTQWATKENTRYCFVCKFVEEKPIVAKEVQPSN